MRVTIIASGSRGDVQPHVALAVGLKKAGHYVRVFTSEDFHDLVTDHDLEFLDIGGSMEAAARSMQDLLDQGNFLKIIASMKQAAEHHILEAIRRGIDACSGSDLIVSGLGGLFIADSLAEKLGIPFVPAHLYPFAPTRDFPGVLTSVPQTPITSWANRLSHRVTQQMMWQMVRSSVNKARAEVLGMKRAPLWGPFASMEKQQLPVVYGYSPQVLPIPSDWHSNAHVTGYWFLSPPADWKPPSELLDFLADGPPPVYVGFGSMISRKSEDAADLVLEALEQTGQRGVLASGWGGLTKSELPPSVFMVKSIPHSWLLPQMRAVVHHGGAGTTAAGLSAGVPSILVPFMGDQGFWGRRIYDLGVGPKPIPRRRLTAAKLAQAIRIAVTDGTIQDTAARLGKRIREENGVASAVDVLTKKRVKQ
jgi:sterol 3beta-glucosyltransferase